MEGLGIALPKLIYQIVNFVLLAWILYAVLYKRVLALLNERTARIEQSLKDADQVKQQLANAKRDYDAEIDKARREAAELLAQAQERAKAQEEEIVARAREEGERIRNEMREQAAQERSQMLRDVKTQIADLVTLTARQVLQDELKGNHDKLIEESLVALERQN
jgi:F-type H+-transporting ATPase subunit b